MLSTDSQLRAARLDEVVGILGQKAAPEDRELVLALAPVVFAEVPDRLALGLPAAALAARLLSHFKFIAREMPPAHQLYKGLPGIHVSARNPGEPESAAMGGGQGLPLETTVVKPTPRTRPSSSKVSRTTSRKRACASSPRSTPFSRCAGSGS